MEGEDKMNKPEWLSKGLPDDKKITGEWRPLGSKGLSEAHLGSIKSQNVLPKSKEVMENLHGSKK